MRIKYFPRTHDDGRSEASDGRDARDPVKFRGKAIVRLTELETRVVESLR
jgi:hypothetical protein